MLVHILFFVTGLSASVVKYLACPLYDAWGIISLLFAEPTGLQELYLGRDLALQVR
jgi:hypothetical protein